MLFQLPEESGAFDGSVPVFKDKILEMEVPTKKKKMSFRNTSIM